MGIFWEYFENILENILRMLACEPPLSLSSTAPQRWAMTSRHPHGVSRNYQWAAVYAMAVGIALSIPPGNSRVPKGVLGPTAERYGRCW